jgi:hypothetical protein
VTDAIDGHSLSAEQRSALCQLYLYAYAPGASVLMSEERWATLSPAWKRLAAETGLVQWAERDDGRVDVDLTDAGRQVALRCLLEIGP